MIPSLALLYLTLQVPAAAISLVAKNQKLGYIVRESKMEAA